MNGWDEAVERLASALAGVAADPKAMAVIAEAMDVPKKRIPRRPDRGIRTAVSEPTMTSSPTRSTTLQAGGTGDCT